MRIAGFRWFRRTVLAFAAVLSSAVGVDAADDPGARPDTRLVAATENRIVFQIDMSSFAVRPSVRLQGTETLEIRGFGRSSGAGEPSLPERRFLVGIPPGAEASIVWRVVRSQALGTHRWEPGPHPTIRSDETGAPVVGEEYRIEDGVYDRERKVIDVTVEPVAQIRRQRVLPIRVAPVSFDPATGETALATLIQVEVLLRGVAKAGEGGRGPEVPARTSPAWDRVFGRVLVNPEQSAAWRARAHVLPPDGSLRAQASEAVSGPLVKLLVRGTGLHRVSATSVAAKGFPAEVPLTDLRVFRRGYDPQTLSEVITDIPYRVVEGTGKPDVFDGADALIFYGQRLREDASREDPLEKFSGTNAYWLGTSGGSPMAAVPVAAGIVSADTAAAWFPVNDYYEDDRVFFDPTPPGEKEFYYFNNGYETSFSTTFDVTSIDRAQSFQLKARFLGGDRSATRTVKLSIRNSRGTTVLDDAVVSGKNVLLYASQVLSAGVIDDGQNTLRLDMTPPSTTLETLLDWFTVEYRARYRARADALEFNSASLAGDTSVTVTGIGRTDVRLFDVTDPLAPREYTLTPEHFTNTGNGYAVSFRESFSSRRNFVITPVGGIREIPPGDVVRDSPSALVGSAAENGVDVLVVSHADFLGEMSRWAGFRRAQGYGVLMADVEDIYDEFNGGVANPRAIKKFIQHFVDTGEASFVVLVGDASEDNRGVSSVAAKNFVPTESYSEYAGGSFDQDEVVTTDNWYAMLGADFINEDVTLTRDFYPDVFLGRLPFGSAAEARDVVDKILKFETPRGDDFWRRRMIRVADNPFSPATGFGLLCYKGDEEGFAGAEEASAAKTEQAIPGGFDVVRFYLAERLGDVEPPHAYGNCGQTTTMSMTTRDRVVPALLGELNAGATLVSFQAHMNRGLVAHEYLFDAAGIWGDRDHLRLTNTERPWIIFGMGCHMSDYAVWDENDPIIVNRNFPNGDALGELLLLQKAGAVATYGSSGFEYLTPNVNLTGVITDAFFDNVPTDTLVASNKAQARWILGELMTVAVIENLVVNPRTGGGDGSVGQTKRFHLLGDPVLRIDGGPPRFDVTVNGAPFTSGEDVSSVASEGVIDVRAVITDEAAIEKVTLEIAGRDSTSIVSTTALKDRDLTAARQYEVRFRHRVEARQYDIVLRAYQAEDTTVGNYHVVGEFVFKVEARAELAVNGRPVFDGDNVPPAGRYVFHVALPVSVARDLVRVEADGEAVGPLEILPADLAASSEWEVRFDKELSPGPHEVVLFAGSAEFAFTLVVGTRAGVLDLIAYPNPFTDDVYFVFTSEVALTGGTVDVFTVSGKKVAHLDIPFHARAPGQNTVRWDGRTFDGKEVANGTYLFVVTIDQGGQKTTERGKLVRVK